jgi:hypothetical protein
VQGRDVAVTVEAADSEGAGTAFSQIAAQVIAPDMTVKPIPLTQVGPGRYRAVFRADQGGSYLLNLEYEKAGQKALMHSAIVVPYAPEFRDLADNTPLLAEVASMTGGRVLKSDPLQADLFSRAGVKFPESAIPLTQPLLLIWLGVFLLDVAVRRVAVDFRAAFARVVAAARKLRPARMVDGTLDRLKSRRAEFLSQAASRRKTAASSVRFEAPAADSKTDAGPGAMPLRDFAEGHDQPSASPATQAGKGPPPGKAPAAAPPEAVSPLEQLLKAKKYAQDRLRKRKDN